MVTSPIEFTKGARKLTVKQGDNEFKFFIPSQHSKQSGQVLIHKDDAKQLAHIAFEESKTIVKSYEEVGTRSCDYEMVTSSCTSDAQGQMSCSPQVNLIPGSQRARYLVNEFVRNIKIGLYYSSKNVLLQTEAQPGVEYEILEKLSSCR